MRPVKRDIFLFEVRSSGDSVPKWFCVTLREKPGRLLSEKTGDGWLSSVPFGTLYLRLAYCIPMGSFSLPFKQNLIVVHR